MALLHGFTSLDLAGASDAKEALAQYLDQAPPAEVLDFCEVCHDQLSEKTESAACDWENGLNQVFEDANLPWRMLAGRIVKLDSDWVERDIHRKAYEVLNAAGFEGPLSEFVEARDALSAGKTNSAVRMANNALESTAKSILGITDMKPGRLWRTLIDSGLVPGYHEDFLKSFEKTLISVPSIGNKEPGARHGTGAESRQAPMSLAKMAVHLASVLIIFLIEHHLERQASEKDDDQTDLENGEIPF